MADLSNPVTQVVVGQAQPAVTVNNLFDAASPAMIFGQNDLTTSGLTWGYYGGRYRGIAIAHGTIALPANQASVYLVAAKATGVVSQSTSTTNWNDATNYDRLYLATTGPTTITDWDDYREVVSSAGAGVATINTETIQDIVGALIVAGLNVSVTYNDASSPATISIAAASGGSSLTQEQVEDIVASLITAGTNITKQYNDGDSPATLVLSASGGGTLTSEQVEDIVGALVVAGSGMTVVYDDASSPPTLTLIATAATKYVQLAASDETTALTTGTAKITFRMPHALTLTAVRASLSTAQASGSIFTVDINEGGSTILSTKLTIDNTEKTSTTAATAAVISDASLADDAEITIDIDQVGDGTAKGLKITLIGT